MGLNCSLRPWSGYLISLLAYRDVVKIKPLQGLAYSRCAINGQHCYYYLKIIVIKISYY